MLVVGDDRNRHQRRHVSRTDEGEPLDLAPQPIAVKRTALSDGSVTALRAKSFERLEDVGQLHVGVVALLPQEWRRGGTRARHQDRGEGGTEPRDQWHYLVERSTLL